MGKTFKDGKHYISKLNVRGEKFIISSRPNGYGHYRIMKEGNK